MFPLHRAAGLYYCILLKNSRKIGTIVKKTYIENVMQFALEKVRGPQESCKRRALIED
jgi:hypothetical protein